MKIVTDPLWDTEIHKNIRHIHEGTALFGITKFGDLMGYAAECSSTWKSRKQIQAWKGRYVKSPVCAGRRGHKWWGGEEIYMAIVLATINWDSWRKTIKC